MSVNLRADSVAVRITLTVINLILFIPLVILIVGCIVGTFSHDGIIGILQSAGAFLVLLFLLFLTAVIIAQLFPNRRDERFRLLCSIIEGMVVLVIAVGGIQLCLNSMGIRNLVDDWNTLGIIKKCAVRNLDTFNYLARRPQLYVFNSLQWFVLSAFGYGEEVMGTFLLSVYFLTAVLLYRISRIISGRVAGVVTFAAAIFMPLGICQTTMVNVYTVSILIVLIHLWLFFISRRLARSLGSESLKKFLVLIAAIVLGLAVFSEPSAFILLLAEPLYICAFQRGRDGENPEDIRKCIIQSVILVLVSLITFLLLMQIKAADLSMSQYEVFNAYLSSVSGSNAFAENAAKIWGYQTYIEPALYYNTVAEYQRIYFAVLSLAIVDGAICFAVKESQSLCIRAFVSAQIICTFLSAEGAAAQYGIVTLLSVMCGGTFAGLYGLLRKKAFDEIQRNEYKLYEHNEEIQAQLQAMNDNDANVVSLENDNEVLYSVNSSETEATYSDNEAQDYPETEKAAGGLADEKSEGEMLSAQDFVSFVNDDDIFDDDPLAGNSVVKIKTEETDIPDINDMPEDEGVITIDDVLGYNTDAENSDALTTDEMDAQHDPAAFIENPLPVPPKHINKDLEFDIEVSDDDDFDIE